MGDFTIKTELILESADRPGRIYFAEIHEFCDLSKESEIAEIGFFDCPPDNLSWENAHKPIFNYFVDKHPEIITAYSKTPANIVRS